VQGRYLGSFCRANVRRRSVGPNSGNPKSPTISWLVNQLDAHSTFFAGSPEVCIPDLGTAVAAFPQTRLLDRKSKIILSETSPKHKGSDGA